MKTKKIKISLLLILEIFLFLKLHSQSAQYDPYFLKFDEIPELSNPSVDCEDYNNDGLPDILVTGSSSYGKISKVFKNNGNKTFSANSLISLTELEQGSAEWGDYNNDNLPDIALTGYYGSYPGTSKIYKNNGDETFTEQTQINLQGLSKGDAEWFNFNNDNYLDLIISGMVNIDNFYTKVYINNGNETFTEQTQINIIGNAYGDIESADFNNDGFDDILICGSKDAAYGDSKLYKNNGDGTFSEFCNFFSVREGSCKWGDYNKDTYPDIIISGGDFGNYNRFTKIYKNNAGLIFAEQTQIELPPLVKCDVGWFDYNNDDFLDLIISGSDITKIFKNNGDDTFTEQSQFNLKGMYDVAINCSDFNNDGFPDILLVSQGASILYQNINGNNFEIMRISALFAKYDNSFAAWGDYDKNGFQDLIFTGKNTDNQAKTSLYNNTGAEMEVSSLIFSSFRNCKAKWFDLNNDGFLDLSFNGYNINNEYQVKIYKNNGNALFFNLNLNLEDLTDGTIDFADYNNDGYQDIILCGKDIENNYKTIIYKNNKSGNFDEVPIYLPGANSAFWSDFDNDNDYDILLYKGSHCFYENISDDKFVARECNFYYDNSAEIILEDFDNNGFIDYASNYHILFKNNSNWQFEYKNFTPNLGYFYDQCNSNSIFSIDYNNDGKSDILTAFSVFTSFFMFENDTFSVLIDNEDIINQNYYNTPILFPPFANGNIAVNDWDYDNDLDFFLSGRDSCGNIISEMIINITDSLNLPPSPPDSLKIFCISDTVFISWAKATDDKTPQNGLSYNCYMYEIGGDTIWHSLSNQGTGENNGRRYISKIGNVQYNTSWYIQGLDVNNEYAWSVQAIDNIYQGSVFAPEDTFRLAPVFLIQPINQRVCENGSIIFNTATSPDAVYKWCQITETDTIPLVNGEIYKNATTPNLTISGASLNMNNFKFCCIASTVGGDTYSNTVTLYVDDYIQAFAGNDTLFCSTEFLTSANLPENSSGLWTCNNQSVIFSNPTSNYTLVSDLPEGVTTLTWTITQNNVCGQNSDNIIITSESQLLQASIPVGQTECVSGDINYQTLPVENTSDYVWLLIPSDAGNITENGIYATISWNENYFGDAHISVAGVNSCIDTFWSEALNINIPEIPVKAIPPIGDTSICRGTTSSNYTTDIISDVYEYNWLIEPVSAGSVSGTGTTASVIWNTSYFGSASLKVRGKNCNYGEWSDELSVKVYIDVPVKLSTPSGTTNLCINPDISIYTTLFDDNAVNYIWELSNQSGALYVNSNNVEIDWNDSFTGIANLKVKGENICGEGDFSDNLVINISDIPEKLNAPQGETKVCSNSLSTYLVNSSIYANYYYWEIFPAGSGEITGNSIQITTKWINDFSDNAYLKVKGINECGEGEWSDSLQITISSPMADDIILKSEYLLFTVDSGFSYQWFFENSEIDGANNQYFYSEPLDYGNYQVKIIDKDGCTKMSDIFEYSSETKSSEITEVINIYPNPNSGSFTIELICDFLGEINYKISNAEGKILLKNKISKKSEFLHENIVISDVAAGLYFIELSFDNKLITKQIVIE